MRKHLNTITRLWKYDCKPIAISILMWRERKAAIQTLGRVADTKLIFPLMIILTVLIVIVMTPAILQL